MSWYKEMEDQFMKEFLEEAAHNGLRVSRKEFEKYIVVNHPSFKEPQPLSSFLTSRVDETELYGKMNPLTAKAIWDKVEAIIRVRDQVRIYQNGSRWSVALYGEKLHRPVIFGTAGNRNEGRDFYEMFNNPTEYGFKTWNNVWEDRPNLGTFIPAYKIKENNDGEQPL